MELNHFISPHIYPKSDSSQDFPKSKIQNLSSNLRKSRRNSRRVRPTHSLHLLAVLKEEESRHSGDTVLRGDLGQLVDVDLEELDVLVLLAQSLDVRGDGLAGAAPLGEEVDQHGFVLEGGGEVVLAVRTGLAGFGFGFVGGSYWI